MSFYSERELPRLVHMSMRQEIFQPYPAPSRGAGASECTFARACRIEPLKE